MSQSEEKTRITVDIYGNQYKLMASSSSNYMKKVAEYVNDQMFRIAKGYPRLDSQRIAVLAAVNMADECFQMNKELEELSKLHNSQEETQIRCNELEQALQLKLEQLKQLQEKTRQHEQHKLEQAKQYEQQQLEQASKYEQLVQQFNQLKEENAILQEQATTVIAEKAELIAGFSIEKEELLEHHRFEKAQLQEQYHQDEDTTQEFYRVKEDYRKLQDEYAKLQNEYNEWIQLVDTEPGR